MSFGGLVGAVVGGAIGFFVGGGPVGAMYGAAIGFSLGMMLDPLTPDIPSVGSPSSPQEFTVSSEVGKPISDVAGTAKIIGHLLCYGKEWSKLEAEHQYYMTWVVGICSGQVNTLYTILKNDDVVWEGDLSCPASGGQETIVLTGMGSATFYFGTADQIANSKVGEIIDDDTLNSPLRNLCWCFFDDCLIGNYNRLPTMRFVVKKVPEYAFNAKNEIQNYDCNPAHAIWYILHELTGLPEVWLDTVDFARAATTLYLENRGVSILFSTQQSSLAYLESINVHIGNILRYGSDSKFHPKLIRDDYTVGDLPLIDETTLLEEPSFDRRSWVDTLNEVKVQYSEIIRLGDLGTLRGVGYNHYGQLGLGHNSSVNEFTPVDQELWKMVSDGGTFHTLAIKYDNTLWATGRNDHGQLGLGDSDTRNVLEQVGTNTWKYITGGGYHTFAIHTNGTLWATGCNNAGQLGLGDLVDRDTFVQVDSGSWGVVACGDNFTIAIKTDGTAHATGYNAEGQLGLWDNANRDEFVAIPVGPFYFFVAVACGLRHTHLISHENTLYGMGANTYGQLGVGDSTNRNQITEITVGGPWKTISNGKYHSLAIKQNGTLWGTGQNGWGALGLDDIINRDEFTQAGSSIWKSISGIMEASHAIQENGTLWATGWNGYGQLGLNDSVDRHVLTQVGTASWKSVAGGSKHAVALKE